MRALFDTSVLIPVFLEDREHHERRLQAFLGADRRRDRCAAHSLAEVYSTMTQLPGHHRRSGEQVELFLESIRERLALIALTGEEYHAATVRCSRREAVKNAMRWARRGRTLEEGAGIELLRSDGSTWRRTKQRILCGSSRRGVR